MAKQSGPIAGTKGLTEQQAAFVHARLTLGQCQTVAARTAGYAHPDQRGYELSRHPQIKQAIQDRQDLDLVDLVGLAQKRLKEILSGPALDKDDKAVLVQAGKAVFSRADQRAKQLRDNPADQAKALQSLDVPGLMALVKEMEGRYIDVTPAK